MKPKNCRGCRFKAVGCANKYRANWKDRYRCDGCWYYSKNNEDNGYCIVDVPLADQELDPIYRESCYSGCSRYRASHV